MKTENTFLKEKNETLYNLGKIALEKSKKVENEIEILEDEDSLDVLVKTSVENKNNSFNRITPVTFAAKAKANASVEQETKQNQQNNPFMT